MALLPLTLADSLPATFLALAVLVQAEVDYFYVSSVAHGSGLVEGCE